MAGRMPRCLVFALTLLSCASPNRAPEILLAAGAENAPGIETVLVLPLNVDTQLPEFLIDAADEIRDSVHRRFEQEGRQVKTLGLAAAYAAWKEARDGTSGEGTAERAAARLAAAHRVDAVVFADLEVVPATFNYGKTARWDGRAETVEITIEGKPEVRNSSIRMKGNTRGLSLETHVFGPQGEPLFRKRVPIELVDRIRMRGWKYWVELRPDLCADERVLDQSVGAALSPFLPAPPPRDVKDAR